MGVTFVWPAPGYKKITSYFGSRFHPVLKVQKDHTGIDIGAPAGATIVSVAPGTVSKVADNGSVGYGKEIQIDHGGGVVTLYGHNSKIIVSEGQVVNAGDKISEAGSTGYSTGPHLHFEVRVNGVCKDPVNYVNADSPVIVNEVDYENTDAPIGSHTDIDIDSINKSAIASIDFANTTVGQRVSGLTPQPLHPFINIYVGSDLKLLSSDPPKPNIVQSFEVDRIEGAAEKATITLFDDNWDELEEVLSRNADRIYIQYGYYGTGLKSKLVKHQLSEYSISFNSTGTVLNISSLTQGAYDNLKPKTIELSTYNPTEAVKKICTELGYTVKDENFEASADIVASDPFNMIEEHPISYIQNVIIPQAARFGEELFSFRIDENNVAYFQRESYSNSRTDNARTYIYQKGYDSPIIDIEFDIKGWYSGVGEIGVTTGVKSTIVDAYTKKQSTNSADKSSVVTEATGDTTHTASDQSTVVTDSAGYSESQMSNKLYYRMKNHKYDGYKCNMTIIGDPTIELMEAVRVINLTDTGNLHHTSGVYLVIGIKDSIQGGEYTTSLEMIKNATSNIEGVEVLNPKHMIK